MRFRTPTFQASRDPNDEGFKPGMFRVSTMPSLRERKSKPKLNTNIALDTEGPQSATSEPLLSNQPMLKKKRPRPSFGSRAGAGNDAPREDVPSVPSMPIQYLKRKLSRPNLNNPANSESIGDAPEVPAVPPAHLKRKQSKPSVEDAEWTPGDDGRIISKKEALKDLLTRTGTTMKIRTAKLDTRISEKRPKVAPERTSPIQRRGVNGSPTERPRTAGSKTFDDTRNPARQSRRKFSVDVPTVPAETPADFAKKLLSVDQVRSMCIGAPSFSVEECNGRYKPQVMFRGSNAETSAEFPKDYQSFGHPSFISCTLSSQQQKDNTEELVSNDEDSDSQKPFADLTEVPSMLESHGIDPGAVGFEYFLQLPIADDLCRLGDSDVSDKRDLLASAPGELGLRKLNIEVLIYRLTELSQLYAQSKDESSESSQAWNETKIEEMGTEVFGKLLSSDQGATSALKGSVDMASQIRALQKVLRTSGLWRDFGLVEWRTRLGQLLWGAESTKEDDGVPCERDILILQITLAAELLVRINVVKLMADISPILSTREIGRLDKQRTTKVKWDLLLAVRFMDNIDISAKMTTESGHEVNRSSLISAIPFLSAGGAPDDGVQVLQPRLTPKHSEQQLEGLRYFSQVLEWPHIDELPLRTDDEQDSSGEERPGFSRAPSTYMTPISTPRLSYARMSRNSSFGLVGLEAEQPALSKTTLAQTVQLIPSGDGTKNVSFEDCGWLSRSWLSGLIMPGDAASQFLISTLLESSPRAMATLGGEANPYGGFLYESRSYWNKNCVVGRVMAAKKGATECMEWISVPAISEAQEDGWVNLAVKEMPDAKIKPRITNPEAVARDSDLLHDKGLLGTARVGDFTWPSDDTPIIGNEVICQGLSFNNSVKLPPLEGETAPVARSMAMLTFGSMIKRKLTVVEIPLIYDARFISSYPCHPKGVKATPTAAPVPAPTPKSSPKPPALSPFPLASMENKENKAPSSNNSEVQQRPKTTPSPVDSGYGSNSTSASTISFNAFKDELAASKSSASTPIHPLHIDYHYDIVPVTTLFTAATETRPRAFSSGAERLQPEVQAAAKEVMVLDCRGADDLELFARAWCAKVGENAIIGKSGRTCLACCVREARALGVCVVIRT